MNKIVMLLCLATLSLRGMEKNNDTSEIFNKKFNQIPLKLGTVVNNTNQNLLLISSLGEHIIDLPAGSTINLNTVIEPQITPISIRHTRNFLVYILPENQKANLINQLNNANTHNEKQTALLTFISVYQSLNPENVAYIQYQLSKERGDIALTVGLNNVGNFTYKIKPEYIKIKRTLPARTITVQLVPFSLNVILSSANDRMIGFNTKLQLLPEINNIKLYKTIEQKDFQAVKQQIRSLNLNMVDERGNNPLHHAVKHGSPEIITLLLQAAPALAALKNYNGQTPVDLAAGNFDILQLFVLPRASKQCAQ